MIRNLRDLPHSLTLSALVSSLVAVLVGYTGPLLIVVQAAENAGLDRAHLSSWIWAVTVGSGVSALLLSLWYRQPILVAWPTAGAALLVSSLAQYQYAEAIGAYLMTAVALVVLGFTGMFGRIMAHVPRSIIAGMLAGVLLKFGTGLFKSFAHGKIIARWKFKTQSSVNGLLQ